ncbi:hypothetical protein M2322_002826 [Rhodoblastus acidophilus]|uniref:putative porin n=1 Tax=Rhodoblastus acidophilus TaxID=1074 RepID=UPI002224C6BF|nr:putative porin [Rhodoblastus acidophilus]MCW2317267.1 hypothetical protein [Rhodoblastus acidophilus]
MENSTRTERDKAELKMLLDRYDAAAHRVQTGIAFMMGTHDYKATEPKHLRVGVDLTKADQGSLARLLVEKGVITEKEYVEAMVKGMEAEADNYAKVVRAAMGGVNVKLV